MKKGISILLLMVLSCMALGNTKLSIQEGKAECVMEVNSRRILYESNGDTRLPMASTTKIVTAITILELSENLSEEIVIPKEAEGVEGSSVYLKAGEKYTIKDLLYGLMLRSGNDCATALALHCSGGLDDFSVKMNKIAQEAGALCSRFQNPHGLPAKEHYTTARDLTAISCHAMQNQNFREIVATQYYSPRHWKNKNKMLYQYDGGIGIKTGYTKEAGRCLVSAAEKNGMILVCTLLNCPTTYERTAKLLDDAFRSYYLKKLLCCGDKFSINNKIGIVKEEFEYPLLSGEEEAIEYLVLPTKNKLNTEIIGHLEIRLAKRLLFSTNLYKL